ncbi:MAG: 30S ribosomal protein S5 [Chitinophagales bacterium]
MPVKRVKPTDIENIHDRVVALNRVAKVTKGGRTFSFAAIVVVGDGEGSVGHGLGKAREVTDAISKGKDAAMRNMIAVPLRNGTIPHPQIGKFGAGKVLLRPASKGTGVIAGGAMRAVLESAGITDVIAKSLGSSNPHNVIKATLDALIHIRPADQIARERGISLNKVFNGN